MLFPIMGRHHMELRNARQIQDFSYYEGPDAIIGIRFRRAGRELGVHAWGMNVLEIDAGCNAYPEHNHLQDGQEEVYVVLKGSGTIIIDDKENTLLTGSFIRVPPESTRKILPGSQGITVLALGGTPGQAYPQK